MTTEPDRLPLPAGGSLAFRRLPGAGPELVFLCGLRSDMEGAKALFVEAWCRSRGRAFTRFDYRGHGRSTGRFEEGSIGDWLKDTEAVLEGVVAHRFVLVGSSMGGWLAVLAGRARPARLAGLVGIAAAPDFTADLIEGRLDAAQRALLARQGHLDTPSAYGPPLRITRRLIEEGRRHLVLKGPIPVHCPVHLLHGQADPDVPWPTALRLAARLESSEVTVELVADGDHRLSRDLDLRRLGAALERLSARTGPAA